MSPEAPAAASGRDPTIPADGFAGGVAGTGSFPAASGTVGVTALGLGDCAALGLRPLAGSPATPGFVLEDGVGEDETVEEPPDMKGESVLLGADVEVVVDDGSTTRTTPLMER